jgi:transcriptional regulator with XRE-family HTH domain
MSAFNAQALERLRWDEGLWQQELAWRAGLSAATISNLEGGRDTDPRLSTVVALAAALGVTIDVFIPGDYWKRWPDVGAITWLLEDLGVSYFGYGRRVKGVWIRRGMVLGSIEIGSRTLYGVAPAHRILEAVRSVNPGLRGLSRTTILHRLKKAVAEASVV